MSGRAGCRVQDPRDFGRVALVIGGDSAEREVSLDGGRAVAAALERGGVELQVCDGPGELFATIRAGGVDRVFNLLHGPGGEDGALQGALRLMGVPVTGAGVLGSALSMDKIRSKWVWQHLGIPTPPFVTIEPGDTSFEEALDTLRMPLFVKPSDEGSSIGISKVKDPAELGAAVSQARAYSPVVIAEQGIAGGEYTASVLGDDVFPLVRIVPAGEFYDYDAKYVSDDTRYDCPTGLPDDLEASLREQALAAFRALDVSGWGRVDFLLDEQQNPWFMEVNTTPGMTSHSLMPKAAAQVGIDFDALVWRILETSL